MVRRTREAVRAFVQARLDKNSSEDDVREKLLAVVRRFPDYAKTADHLAKLVSVADGKMWKPLTQCLDTTIGFEALREARVREACSRGACA